MKIPTDVARYIKQFEMNDYNTCQATSLAWAEHFDDYLNDNWTRNLTIRIDTYCHDCKDGGQFLPSTVRDFISRHKGHNTKTIKLR